MHTGQALFPLKIKPAISRVWKKLLATEAQAIWLLHLVYRDEIDVLYFYFILHNNNNI